MKILEKKHTVTYTKWFSYILYGNIKWIKKFNLCIRYDNQDET